MNRSNTPSSVARLWCALAASALCSAVAGQTSFHDDAGREVALPENVQRVFAAGAPAEVLLYTLVPDKLPGRNMTLSTEALAFIPPGLRGSATIANLPERDDARYDAELLALDVDVYVDYGTVDADYTEALEAISERSGIPGVIVDGRLTMIPDAYRRLGVALDAPEHGSKLAAESQRLLDKYRGALARAAPRVYIACSQNGLSPCYRGHSAAEVANHLGAVNAAGSIETAGRRPLTIAEIRALEPDIVIAASRDSAAAMRADDEWRSIPAVAAGRIHAPPSLPFNWGPRPPSVNRLAGLIWMAYAVAERPFDDEFFADVGGFFESFYHTTPTVAQLRELVGASP